MLRTARASFVRFIAAAAYLLALAAGSLPHAHDHAGDGCRSLSGCCTTGEHASHLADGCEHEATNADSSALPHDGAPIAPDEDCSLCRLVSRPFLAVRPFEIGESPRRVVPVAVVCVPDVLPVVVVIAVARAPPLETPTV